MRNAVLEVVRRYPLEAKIRVKRLQMGLCGDFDRNIAVSRCDEIERLPDQPSPQARLAISRRGDDPSDPCTGVSRVGSENAQISGETPIGIPGKQMIRLRVATVDVRVGALLLDDEHLASEAQQRIEFGRG